MIDHQAQPNPGPHDCSPTAIVLNRETLEVEYRFDYYMYGHFSKWIRPGAIRIDSGPDEGALSTVAFLNTDESRVLVVVNPGGRLEPMTLEWGQKKVEADLNPKTMATFLWKP